MTLLDGVLVHYAMDENSGNAIDAHIGKYDLTDNNTVGSTTGVINGARNFTSASSEYFSITDNIIFSPNNITILCWAKFTTLAANMVVCGKYLSTGDGREYRLLYLNSSNRLQWLVSKNGLGGGGNALSLLANNFGAPSTATWYFIMCRWDGTDIEISVNDGTADSAAFTGGISDTGSDFVVGARSDGTAEYLDGAVDLLTIYNRALTDDEVSQHYNNGNGLAYPFGVTTPVEVITPAIPSFHQSNSISIKSSEPLVKTDRSQIGTILSGQLDTYNHEIRREGGYYSATIKSSTDEETLNDWLQSGINRHIEVFNPSLEKIWEGFVNQISIVFGENTYQIGPLINIGNKVAVLYSTIDTSVDPPILGIREQTDYASNATSQNIYGIWEKLRSINGASQTEAEQIRDMFLNDPTRAFPVISNNLTMGGSGNLSITLKCLGYWAYLKAYYYTNSATGTTNLSQQIEDVLTADVNSIFSTDYSKITTNTTQVPDGIDQAQFAETLLKKLNSQGDSSNNAYSIGFYNNRVLRYEAISDDIEYQKRRGKRITGNLGEIIQPWDIKPAKWLFQPDFLVGRHPPITGETLGTDPRAMLIDVVKYSSPYGLSLSGARLGELDQILARQGLGGVA